MSALLTHRGGGTRPLRPYQGRARRNGRPRHAGLVARQQRADPHQHRHLLPSPVRTGVPRRLVVATPGQRQHLRHARLGADAVAVRDRDGQDRGLVRPGRRGLALGVPRDRALRHALRGVPRPRRAAGRGGADRDRAPRDAERALDAAAGDQLSAGRGRGRRLAAYRPRRTDPMVAGPARLGLGDAARDVAGRPGGRRRSGGRPGTRPGAAAPARPGSCGAGRVGGRRGPETVGPSSTPPWPRSGRAPSTSPSGGRRTGRAGSSAPWLSSSCSPASRCGDDGTTRGRRSCSWRSPWRSPCTRSGPCLSRPR